MTVIKYVEVDTASSRLAVMIQGNDRTTHYHTNARPDIAALVPPTARRILEVGCGEGRLGAVLSERGHSVCGIELIPEVAEIAAGQLVEVICGNVETTVWPWPSGSFDAVICADVLEHLIDPWQTLRRLAALLVPGGILIASIPNVQNWRVIRSLIRGRWDYRERGILDRGHLRFFTWRGIERLCAQARLEVVQRQAVWNRTVWRKALCWATAGRAEPFLARSYLVVARNAQANHSTANSQRAGLGC